MIPLFPQKYKKDVYFLLTAEDKWSKAKYLRKIKEERFCFIPNVNFHFSDNKNSSNRPISIY